MTKRKNKSKKDNEETKQIKITLPLETYTLLETACAFQNIKKSEYIKIMLEKKFKKVSDDTTITDLKKIMKI